MTVLIAPTITLKGRVKEGRKAKVKEPVNGRIGALLLRAIRKPLPRRKLRRRLLLPKLKRKLRLRRVRVRKARTTLRILVVLIQVLLLNAHRVPRKLQLALSSSLV